MEPAASTFSSFPQSRAEWRALALKLADLPVDQVAAGESADFEQLRDTAWDVATYAAYWHTVQLPSLGPGLLPWTVLVVAAINTIVSGHWPDRWPDVSDPFLLWPSLWLLGWFGLTLILAVVRHRRAQHRVLTLGTRFNLFPNPRHPRHPRTKVLN